MNEKSLTKLRSEVTVAISLANVHKQLPASNLNIVVFCNLIVPVILPCHVREIIVAQGKLHGKVTQLMI